MIGPLTYPEKNKFTLEDFNDENHLFAATEAAATKNALDNWVNTQNQALVAAGQEAVYKNWKINDDGLPEVDLGDLDRK